MTNDPVKDALRDGFAALLQGDTHERDRQVERARKIMNAQEAMPRGDVSPKQIVPALLRLVEARLGRPLEPREKAAIEANPAAVMRHMIAEQQAS